MSRPLSLRRDRRGATALEFALVSPALILFMLALVAVYSLVICRRAMDFGVEAALRYAAVHAGSGTTATTSAYNTAAGKIWADVGAHSSVKVSPTTTVTGADVTITATYNWTFPGGVTGSSIFNSFQMSSTGTMRVMN